MVFLGLLGGLLVIGMPIAVIYLLVSHAKLSRNVADLRRIVLGLETATRNETQSQDAPVKPAPPASVDAKGAAPVVPKAAEAPKPTQTMRVKSPSQTQTTPAAPPPTPQGPTALERFFAWLQYNWFYRVSAVSLALAGLFLVQYGMENGLLPPAARVMSALGFGAALIGVAEYIRRRFGESKDSTTDYLPSVFAGGIVSLFGGVGADQPV